ncbi:hypothetical protein [Aeromonas veronii]|uniref:Uncharacterized protein n=1 Tax=Aeromonas veronii TaxID=654 RepID=A0A4V3Z001_AERVE|nr:hypothetical protein [Aeromonas veronii]THJ45052.1 hypothetical protein E8Q35_12775 [Aeromonas veronii]
MRNSESPKNIDLNSLSDEAKESLQAMVDYCIRHGIGMGPDEGIKCFDTNQKHLFREELENICGYQD